MFAHREEVDVLDEHHLLVAIVGHRHDGRTEIGPPGPQAAEQLFVHRRNASRSIGQPRARQILTDALEKESHTELDLAAVHRLTASVEKQRRRRVGLEVRARDLSAHGCGRFAPRPRA